jgi:hypothetical protein
MSDDRVLLDELRRLQDRNAVYDVIVAIAAGIDRYDPALLRSAIWSDADIDMGGAQTITGETFAAALKRPETPAAGRMHIIGNHRIRLSGDCAESESYVMSCQELAAGDGAETRVRAGRYLDRFERRDGTWKLSGRLFIDEWSRLDPVVGRPALGRYAGAPAPDDLAYQTLGLNTDSPA